MRVDTVDKQADIFIIILRTPLGVDVITVGLRDMSQNWKLASVTPEMWLGTKNLKLIMWFIPRALWAR